MELSVVGKPVKSGKEERKSEKVKAEELKKQKEESAQAHARAAAERIRSRKRMERESQAATVAAAAAAKKRVVDEEQERIRKYELQRAEVYALNRLMKAVDGARGRAHDAGTGTIIGQV